MDNVNNLAVSKEILFRCLMDMPNEHFGRHPEDIHLLAQLAADPVLAKSKKAYQGEQQELLNQLQVPA